jgi:uncharacterized repeat protein (TIGR01451 family)
LLPSDVEFINNKIYVSNSITSSNNPLYEYDNGSWTALTVPGFNGKVHTIKEQGGVLYLAGNFSSSLGNNVLKFSNGVFSSAPTLPTNILEVYDLEVYNNNLYLGNHDTTSFVKTLYRLSGNSWSQAATFTQGTGIGSLAKNQKIFSYQNNLYCSITHNTGESLFLVANDTMHYLDDLEHTASDVVEHNNEIYISGVDDWFASKNFLSKFDGVNLSPIGDTPILLYGVESYGGNLIIVAGVATQYKGVVSNRVYQTSAGFSTISGKVFIDQNSNCTYQSFEHEIENQLISFGPGIRQLSDQNGAYSVGLAPGTYPIDSSSYMNLEYKNSKFTCVIPSQITVGANQNLVQDFSMINTVGTDMTVHMTSHSGWRARFGFNEKYVVDVINAGNSNVLNCQLKVTFPSTVNITSTSPAPSSISGNVYTYNILNMQPYENERFVLIAEIDTAQNNLLDSITWKTELTGITGDADLSDNVFNLDQQIVGAYDPNDKQASAYRILPSENKIDYHIRFQNTGSDTAYKVTVVDTLDTQLPLTSVVINSASHAYNLRVENNILIWEFENILLPDSGTNFVESQGYANFSTNITPGLAVGDSILNKAEIYFDFQHPIITNHAKTVVVQQLSLEEDATEILGLKVYPNPSQEFVIVESMDNNSNELVITDMQGKIVKLVPIAINNKTRIDIQYLNAGTYILSVGKSRFKLIVAQ